MSGKFLFALPLLLASCTSAEAEAQVPPASQWTEACADWDEWDKPGPAFRIHGDTYYVGTCGIGAIFIEYAEGFVLIDTGTEAGAAVVLDNIRTVANGPLDVGMILQSHEHHDHVGGLARVAAALAITPTVNDEVYMVYQTGEQDPRDPQFGTLDPMEPLPSLWTFTPGVAFELDGLVVQSVVTPGHTPGALSWQWESCDQAGTCRTIVYADSMSPVSSDSYRFSDNPGYVAAYRAGIARLAELDCDILLTPHPSASGMRDKLLAGDLASGMNCRQYAASISERLDTRLAEETAR